MWLCPPAICSLLWSCSHPSVSATSRCRQRPRTVQGTSSPWSQRGISAVPGHPANARQAPGGAHLAHHGLLLMGKGGGSRMTTVTRRGGRPCLWLVWILFPLRFLVSEVWSGFSVYRHQMPESLYWTLTLCWLRATSFKISNVRTPPPHHSPVSPFIHPGTRPSIVPLNP